METPDLAPFIANRFSRILREWLTPEEMEEINLLNRTEEDENICHSHDYCDPNEAISQAFEKVVERPMDLDGNPDPDFELCGRAWNLAKKHCFKQVTKVGLVKDRVCAATGNVIPAGAEAIQIYWTANHKMTAFQYVSDEQYLDQVLFP